MVWRVLEAGVGENELVFKKINLGDNSLYCFSCVSSNSMSFHTVYLPQH